MKISAAARYVGIAALVSILVLFLSSVLFPPDHTWMRTAVASDLSMRVDFDSVKGLPVFRVELPDTFGNFDPDMPRYVYVTRCELDDCPDSSTQVWMADSHEDPSTHWHWRTPTTPDEFVATYGDSLPGWTVRHRADKLKAGLCYFVSIRVDNRAGKAAFIVEGDSVIFHQWDTRPLTQPECDEIARKGEALDGRSASSP
ncbi:MAG TPA: hypothetical protein VG940_04250 [Gemmatimonadales bacterium]|nr:hypothetical protein [Gemmatimonadales bacterium]